MTVMDNILFGVVVVVMYFKCCGERCLGCLGYPWCFDFEKCCDPCWLISCCGIFSCICPCGHPDRSNVQKRMNEMRKRAKIHSMEYGYGFEGEGELMNIHTPPGANIFDDDDPYTTNSTTHIVENLSLQNLNPLKNGNNVGGGTCLPVSSAPALFVLGSHPEVQQEPLLQSSNNNNNNGTTTTTTTSTTTTTTKGGGRDKNEIQLSTSKMIVVPENKEPVICVDLTSSQDEEVNKEEEEEEEEEEEVNKEEKEEEEEEEEFKVEEVVCERNSIGTNDDVDKEAVLCDIKKSESKGPMTPVQIMSESVQKLFFDEVPLQIKDDDDEEEEEEVTTDDDDDDDDVKKRRREEEFDMISPV